MITPAPGSGPPSSADSGLPGSAFLSPQRAPGSRLAVWLVALVSLAVLLLIMLAVSSRAWLLWHTTRARNELAKGHNAAAQRHLARASAVFPNDSLLLLLSARVARRSGATDEASVLLKQLELQGGQGEELVLERLLLRATLGEVEAVEQQLAARSSQAGVESELAREGLVTGLIARFRWADAQERLGNWLAKNPKSTSALVLSGKLEENRQGIEPAMVLYRQVLELDPDHDEARLRLVSLLVNNRRGEEALGLVETLVKSLPDNPEALTLWVRSLALCGRNAESRAALADCLNKHPDYPSALLEQGAQALIDGDEELATRALKRAIELDPGNLVARNQYTFALARTGKQEEAAKARAEADRLKADLERITVLIGGPLQQRPYAPDIHHEIAQIALRSGQVKEALEWFERALRVDPGHIPTHRVLAVLYHELDKPVLSARHRALAQKPGDIPAPSRGP